jgi:hypothetical protein
MSVAVAANPGPVKLEDKIAASILAFVGAFTAAIVIKHT